MSSYARHVLKHSLLVLALAASAMAGTSSSTTIAVGVTVLPTLLVPSAEPLKVTQQDGAVSFDLPIEQAWERLEDVRPDKESQSVSANRPSPLPSGTLIIRYTYVLR
jgi:hypothetical protein